LCIGFFDAVRHASLLVALIGTTQFFYFWLLDLNCEKFSFILAQTHKLKVKSQQSLQRFNKYKLLKVTWCDKHRTNTLSDPYLDRFTSSSNLHGEGPLVVVQCTAVNVRFLLTAFKGAGNGFLADMHHI